MTCHGRVVQPPGRAGARVVVGNPRSAARPVTRNKADPRTVPTPCPLPRGPRPRTTVPGIAVAPLHTSSRWSSWLSTGAWGHPGQTCGQGVDDPGDGENGCWHHPVREVGRCDHVAASHERGSLSAACGQPSVGGFRAAERASRTRDRRTGCCARRPSPASLGLVGRVVAVVVIVFPGWPGAPGLGVVGATRTIVAGPLASLLG